MMNHYATLGVCRVDSQEDIKLVYLKIAKQNHPDLTGNDAAKAAVMAEANIAWNILGNRALRQAYDKKLKTLYGTCDTCKGKGYLYKQRGFNVRVLSKCTKCKGAGTEKEIV